MKRTKRENKKKMSCGHCKACQRWPCIHHSDYLVPLYLGIPKIHEILLIILSQLTQLLPSLANKEYEILLFTHPLLHQICGFIRTPETQRSTWNNHAKMVFRSRLVAW